jgi:hypothetical protein
MRAIPQVMPGGAVRPDLPGRHLSGRIQPSCVPTQRCLDGPVVVVMPNLDLLCLSTPARRPAAVADARMSPPPRPWLPPSQAPPVGQHATCIKSLSCMLCNCDRRSLAPVGGEVPRPRRPRGFPRRGPHAQAQVREVHGAAGRGMAIRGRGTTRNGPGGASCLLSGMGLLCLDSQAART